MLTASYNNHGRISYLKIDFFFFFPQINIGKYKKETIMTSSVLILEGFTSKIVLMFVSYSLQKGIMFWKKNILLPIYDTSSTCFSSNLMLG